SRPGLDHGGSAAGSISSAPCRFSPRSRPRRLRRRLDLELSRAPSTRRFAPCSVARLGSKIEEAAEPDVEVQDAEHERHDPDDREPLEDIAPAAPGRGEDL